MLLIPADIFPEPADVSPDGLANPKGEGSERWTFPIDPQAANGPQAAAR